MKYVRVFIRWFFSPLELFAVLWAYIAWFTFFCLAFAYEVFLG